MLKVQRLKKVCGAMTYTDILINPDNIISVEPNENEAYKDTIQVFFVDGSILNINETLEHFLGRF